MSTPWTRYRVFLLESLITDEGDLIIAGTHGTVLHWNEDVDLTKDTDPLVMVQWDHYLYIEGDTDGITYDCPPGKQGDAYTGRLFNWAVPVSKIRVSTS